MYIKNYDRSIEDNSLQHLSYISWHGDYSNFKLYSLHVWYVQMRFCRMTRRGKANKPRQGYFLFLLSELNCYCSLGLIIDMFWLGFIWEVHTNDCLYLAVFPCRCVIAGIVARLPSPTKRIRIGRGTGCATILHLSLPLVRSASGCWWVVCVVFLLFSSYQVVSCVLLNA